MKRRMSRASALKYYTAIENYLERYLKKCEAIEKRVDTDFLPMEVAAGGEVLLNLIDDIVVQINKVDETIAKRISDALQGIDRSALEAKIDGVNKIMDRHLSDNYLPLNLAADEVIACFDELIVSGEEYFVAKVNQEAMISDARDIAGILGRNFSFNTPFLKESGKEDMEMFEFGLTQGYLATKPGQEPMTSFMVDETEVNPDRKIGAFVAMVTGDDRMLDRSSYRDVFEDYEPVRDVLFETIRPQLRFLKSKSIVFKTDMS